MTVEELIKKLEKFDPGKRVEVIAFGTYSGAPSLIVEEDEAVVIEAVEED